ncbi:hypothetical protein Tsubulata_048757 [Turnera subulata]|uniref:Uncharacterized protein n=1 Tax=Turnera subulata TaxID=218843 RepID=A0A9Q0F4I7_9ROSI|nr:hypothetical protein Tsubulata_048757 [Turnera subulata]
MHNLNDFSQGSPISKVSFDKLGGGYKVLQLVYLATILKPSLEVLWSSPDAPSQSYTQGLTSVMRCFQQQNKGRLGQLLEEVVHNHMHEVQLALQLQSL